MTLPATAQKSDNLADPLQWNELGAAFSDKIDDQCNVDTALDLNGVDQGIQLIAGAVITGGSTFTVKCQVKGSLASAQHAIMAQYTDSSNRLFLLRYEVGGEIKMFIFDSAGNTYSRMTTDTYDDLVLRDLMVTVDGTTIVFIINGLPVAMEAPSGTFAGTLGFGTAPPLRMGVRGDGSNPFKGELARDRMWIPALTLEQGAEEFVLSQNCGVTGPSAEQLNRSVYITGSSPRTESQTPFILPQSMEITVDTTISGATASDTFEFPFLITTGKLFVDWGDGNNDTFTSSGTATHTYASGGVKTIKITGQNSYTGTPMHFANGSDKLKITDKSFHGNMVTWNGSGQEAYRGCSNLDISATDVPVMSGDMSAWLRQTNIANFPGLESLDTKDISNLSSFLRATDLSGVIDLTGWNVAKNISMASLFFNTEFTTIDITGWVTNLNTSLVQTWRTVTGLTDIIGLESINIEAVTNADTAILGTALPTARMDAVLSIVDGWASQAMQSGYNMHLGAGTYSKGQVDSGTTDGVAANKLIESGQNFLTTVSIGDIIKNTTDTTFAKVTAVDSNTQLSLDEDTMTSGETYEVHGSDAAKGVYRMTHDFGIILITGGAV